jgi:insulysin
MTRLYAGMVRDKLKEFSYTDEVAGLEFFISPNLDGLEIGFSVYNEMLDILLREVLRAMRDLRSTEDRFRLVKERLLRSMRRPAHNLSSHNLINYLLKTRAIRKLCPPGPSVFNKNSLFDSEFLTFLV